MFSGRVRQFAGRRVAESGKSYESRARLFCSNNNNNNNNSLTAVPSFLSEVSLKALLVAGRQGPLLFGRARLRLWPSFKMEQRNPHIHASVKENHRKP